MILAPKKVSNSLKTLPLDLNTVILLRKYAGDAYVIDEEEDQRLRHRQATFVRESGTKKTVLTTMITTYGLSKGGYSDEIHSQVVMSDLFRNADFDD